MKQIKFMFITSMAFVVSFSSLMSVLSPNAHAATKIFSLPESTSQTQTHTITLPNLQSINSITANTGTATVQSISGDQVTVRISGGSYSRRTVTGGSAADSKTVTDQTSANYNSGGYSGTLSSYVYSGTAPVSKTVTDSRVSSSNIFSSTISYNSGGYSGSLSKSGSASSKLISGTAADSKTVTNQTSASYNSGGYSGTLTQYVYSGSYTPEHMGVNYLHTVTQGACPSTYSGYKLYSSNPTVDGFYQCVYEIPTLIPASDTRVYRYQGTVTKPDTRVYEYTQNYSGTVSTPDTRVYRYSGTVSKPDTRSYQYYYQYSLTVDYIDNTAPVLTVVNASQKVSAVSGYNTITLQGTVQDADNNNVTISAVINGKTKSTVVSSTSTVKNWTLSWNVATDNLSEGVYSSVPITANDGAGGTASAVHTGAISIDRTQPTATFTPNGNSAYAKSHTTKLTTADSGSGVATRQYAWSSSNTTTPTSWTNFTEGQNLSAPSAITGNRYLWIKVTDSAGNELISKSNVFRLDNTAPTIAFAPELIEPTFKDLEVQTAIADSGGAGFKQSRYVWTKDQTRPSEGWSEWDATTNPTIKQDKGGKWYLHIEAVDTLGNARYANSGIYEKIVVSGGPSVNINVFPTPTGVWLNQPIDVYVMESGDADMLAKAKKTYEVTNSPLYPSTLSKTIPTDKKVRLNLVGENFVHVQYVLDDGTKISATAGPYLIDTGAIGTFTMKLTKANGTEATSWANEPLTLVLSNPSTTSVSGTQKQYRIEGLHTDWQNYTDGTKISLEGEHRIFGRILNAAGISTEQKIVTAKIDQTKPEVVSLSLVKKDNGRYDISMKASDTLSGIKDVKTNSNQVLTLNNNRFELRDLTTKPTSLTLTDQAGNALTSVAFATEPAVTFDSPYGLSLQIYTKDVLANLTNATGYLVGNRGYTCTTNPCKVTISNNTTLTAVNTIGIKETKSVIKISNIDKNNYQLILSGKRVSTTPSNIEFNWNLSLDSGTISCVGTDPFNQSVTGTSTISTGKNNTYNCTLTGFYKGQTMSSNTISVYANANGGNGNDSLITKEIDTNVYITETKLGKGYIINAKSDNYKYSTLPFPENDITKD